MTLFPKVFGEVAGAAKSLDNYFRSLLANVRGARQRSESPPNSDTLRESAAKFRRMREIDDNSSPVAIAGMVSGEVELSESKTFRRAGETWISSVTGIHRSLLEWTTGLHGVKPSMLLREILENPAEVFRQSNEAGTRVIIDAFLYDILGRPEFRPFLQIFLEVKLGAWALVDGQKKSIHGIADYTIGLRSSVSTPPAATHLVAIEAKYKMKRPHILQCIAQTASLHVARKLEGCSDCTVWGVLSDSLSWKFVQISHDGILTESHEYQLVLVPYDEEQVERVYRVLYDIVSRTLAALMNDPTASWSDSSDKV
jgi:hypothetical protein